MISKPSPVTEEQFHEIVTRLKNGEKACDLAREFNVWDSYISKIKYGRTKYFSPECKLSIPRGSTDPTEERIFKGLWQSYVEYKAKNPYANKNDLMKYLITEREKLQQE